MGPPAQGNRRSITQADCVCVGVCVLGGGQCFLRKRGSRSRAAAISDKAACSSNARLEERVGGVYIRSPNSLPPGPWTFS